METVLIGGVIGKLGKPVGEQAVNGVRQLLSFKEDFEWLEDKLQCIQGLLQSAHDSNDEAVKKWLARVQDIAFDAEDIIEECDVQPQHSNFIQACACIWDSLFFRFRMGRRIRKLNNRIVSIMKEATGLQLCHSKPTVTFQVGAEEWNKSSLLERDARPVAIDAKVEQIVNLLKNDSLQVVAVVGMGGIGKTFLLQNVCNHHWIQETFKKAIWLSISQDYKVSSLQFDIASHLNLKDGLSGVTEQRAADLIRDVLKDRVSLIVLDDVWKEEGVRELIEKLGIPYGTSCKVLVSTRNNQVCKNINDHEIYRMELLSEQDSWNLFCLYAFSDNQYIRPSPELEDVAHLVERECGRLPLAIKTVTALMAKEKDLRNWKVKLQQLNEVSKTDDPIMPIIRLSYDALPAVLKPCFLYFSFFGEDEEIDAISYIFMDSRRFTSERKRAMESWME